MRDIRAEIKEPLVDFLIEYDEPDPTTIAANPQIDWDLTRPWFCSTPTDQWGNPTFGRGATPWEALADCIAGFEAGKAENERACRIMEEIAARAKAEGTWPQD